MVAEFYEVDLSTINRYIAQYEDELKYNGYFLCRGKLLKELKLQFGHVINEMTKSHPTRTFQLWAVLNMGMLLTESEKAKTSPYPYSWILSSLPSINEPEVEPSTSTLAILTFFLLLLKKIITVRISRRQSENIRTSDFSSFRPFSRWQFFFSVVYIQRLSR